MRARLAAGVLCFGLIGLSLGAAAPGLASERAALLPFQNLQDMVVDRVHKHVFVTGGPTGPLHVLDFSGNVVKTIDLPHAGRMLIDGERLYVAAPPDGRVIDTETLTLMDGAAKTRAPHAVWAGGTNWWRSGAGLVSSEFPAQPQATWPLEELNSVPVSFPSVKALAARPDSVFVYSTGRAGSKVFEFDVATGSPVLVRSAISPRANLHDFAITSDGGQLLLASSDAWGIESYDSAHPDGELAYVTGPRPVAVEVSPDGKHVAVALQQATGADVIIFRTGEKNPITTIDFGVTGLDESFPDALEFGSNKVLFALTGASSNTVTAHAITLEGLTAKRTPTSLSLGTSSPRVAADGTVWLDAKLKPSKGVKGRKVAVYAMDTGEYPRLIETKKVNAAGAARVAVSLTKSSQLFARYAGDSKRAPATSMPVPIEVQP